MQFLAKQQTHRPNFVHDEYFSPSQKLKEGARYFSLIQEVFSQGFQLDMKENWEKVTMITIDDKLEALR